MTDWGPRPFKFYNAWLSKKGCSSLVKEEWGGSTGDKERLSIKLRKLKGKLKKWNEEEGCVMEGNIKFVEDRLKELNDLNEKMELSIEEKEEFIRLNVELWQAIKFRESVSW